MHAHICPNFIIIGHYYKLCLAGNSVMQTLNIHARSISILYTLIVKKCNHLFYNLHVRIEEQVVHHMYDDLCLCSVHFIFCGVNFEGRDQRIFFLMCEFRVVCVAREKYKKNSVCTKYTQRIIFIACLFQYDLDPTILLMDHHFTWCHRTKQL